MEGLSNTVSVVLVISLWLFTALVLFWERVENNLFCVCVGQCLSSGLSRTMCVLAGASERTQFLHRSSFLQLTHQALLTSDIYVALLSQFGCLSGMFVSV